MLEERDSERDLMRESFNRPADYSSLFVKHILKMRPNNLKRQYVVFSVWAVYPETIQGGEDVIGPRVCP